MREDRNSFTFSVKRVSWQFVTETSSLSLIPRIRLYPFCSSLSFIWRNEHRNKRRQRRALASNIQFFIPTVQRKRKNDEFIMNFLCGPVESIVSSVIFCSFIKASQNKIKHQQPSNFAIHKLSLATIKNVFHHSPVISLCPTELFGDKKQVFGWRNPVNGRGRYQAIDQSWNDPLSFATSNAFFFRPANIQK